MQLIAESSSLVDLFCLCVIYRQATTSFNKEGRGVVSISRKGVGVGVGIGVGVGLIKIYSNTYGITIAIAGYVQIS